MNYDRLKKEFFTTVNSNWLRTTQMVLALGFHLERAIIIWKRPAGCRWQVNWNEAGRVITVHPAQSAWDRAKQ